MSGTNMSAAALSSALPRPLTAAGVVQGLASQQPTGIASYHRTPSGAWTPTSWLELWQEIQRAAVALKALGLARGNRLAIMARTSREWQIAEIAATYAG